MQCDTKDKDERSIDLTGRLFNFKEQVQNYNKSQAIKGLLECETYYSV